MTLISSGSCTAISGCLPICLCLVETQVYSRKQLAALTQDAKDGKPDAKKYIIVDNKLYDVTEFVDDHPGGAAVLLTHVGKDASGILNRAAIP